MGISIAGLFDDNLEVKSLLDFPVYGAFDSQRLGNDSLIVSVGVNNIRNKIVDKLSVNILYGKAIHPSAVVSEYATVDMGTVVMQVVHYWCRLGGYKRYTRLFTCSGE